MFQALQPLNGKQPKTAEEYVAIFKPFKSLTAVMGASEYPTISMVIPELNKLRHTQSNESTESTIMPALTEDHIANIDQRWPNYKYKSIYSVSTIVHPR